MINVTVQCRRSKVTSKGVSRVEAVVNDGGRRIVMNTDFTYDPERWRKEIAQRRGNQAKVIEAAVRDDVSRRMALLVSAGIELSAENIRNVDRLLHKPTISEVMDGFLATLKPRVGNTLSWGQYRKYMTVCGDIAAIGKLAVEVTPNDISAIHSKYSVRYKPSTLAGMATKLKTAVGWCHSNGYMAYDPSGGIKVRKVAEKVETVTEAEYAKIKSKTLIGRLERVRDAFVFMANSGLSFTDLTNFKADNVTKVRGNTIYVNKRKKTGVEFYSVLLPDAVAVMEKYGKDLNGLAMSNQRTNAYLKEIADLCGISIALTCHKARHRYARKLLMMKLPIEVIQKCLGHSNVKETEHYCRLLKDQNLELVANAFNAL